MTLQEFFNTHNGKKIDFDGSFGAQCKDLFSFYNRDVVKNPQYVPGNAWKLYENCPIEYYKVAALNAPQKGDVAVWKEEFGGFGHVAIVWDNDKFFSQNYPLGKECSLQTIPTFLLLGYLRPRITNGGKMAFNDIQTAYKNSLNDPDVIKLILRDRPGNKQAIIRRFDDGSVKVRYDVSDHEFISIQAGPVSVNVDKVKDLPTF